MWACEYQALDRVWELLTSDLSIDRFANAPGGGAAGIGGDSNKIWLSDVSGDYYLKIAVK